MFFRGKTSEVLHRLVLFHAGFIGVCKHRVVQKSKSFAKLDRLNLAKPWKRLAANTPYEATGIQPAQERSGKTTVPIR